MERQGPRQVEWASETGLTVIDAPVMASPAVSLQDWADEITRTSGQAIEKILNIGRMMIKARQALKHGQWQRLFKGHRQAVARPAPYTVAAAKMFMKIALHPVLSNRNLGYCLPPNWSALYQLSFLPEPLLGQLITSGIITPQLRKADALALRYYHSPSSPLHRRISPKKAARHLKCYADNIESLQNDQAILRHYAATVAAELAAPLQFSEEGRIRSGVYWLPSFVDYTPPLKAEPITTTHRCECGDLHEDRRTKP